MLLLLAGKRSQDATATDLPNRTRELHLQVESKVLLKRGPIGIDQTKGKYGAFFLNSDDQWEPRESVKLNIPSGTDSDWKRTFFPAHIF